MNESPADLMALTSGLDLLIGKTPVNLPEAPVGNDSLGHPTARWMLLSNMRYHFWRRWSTEYLHHLQQLSKWREPSDNLLADWCTSPRQR